MFTGSIPIRYNLSIALFCNYCRFETKSNRVDCKVKIKMNNIDTAEQLESKYDFYNAGMLYLQIALSESDSLQSPELFMKAARCFQKAEISRLSYFSWSFCADSISARLEHAQDGKDYNLDEFRFLNRLQPYTITDKKWNEVEKNIYTKLNGVEPNKIEKDKHRRAWALDFAGQIASRDHRHSTASLRYRQAGQAWSECSTFSGYQSIAAKFYTYAICEAIHDLGLMNFIGSYNAIDNDLAEFEKLTIRNPSFAEYVRDFRKYDEYLKLSRYLYSIRSHAYRSGLTKMAYKCIKLENICKRRFLWSKRMYISYVLNCISLLSTGNGTSYLRLLISTFFTAFIVFPLLYTLVELPCIQKILPSGIQNGDGSFFEKMYFS